MLLYMNHMVTTNQKIYNRYVCVHKHTHTERNPNISLKTIIASQGKRAK